MASITLREIPPELHAQLKAAGEANFRSMQQGALARIERSIALDDQLSTHQVNRLIDDSIASGPERIFPGTILTSWIIFYGVRDNEIMV